MRCELQTSHVPPPPPLHPPRCQSPHWGDTYHRSGKELFCNNTQRYQRVTEFGKSVSFSPDIKVYRLSGLDKNDKMTAFPLMTNWQQWMQRWFWEHLRGLHAAWSHYFSVSGSLAGSAHWASARVLTPTHSQIYLGLPACSLSVFRTIILLCFPSSFPL